VDLQFVEVETPEDFDVYMQLRKQVFCGEQGVPESLEIEREDECWHFLVRQAGHVVATGRVLPIANDAAKIQRVAVRKDARRQGIGAELMRHMEGIAAERGRTRLLLHAQVDAVPFYEALGYEVTGASFVEANIVHYPMRKGLAGG